MDKLKMHSVDKVQEHIEQIGKLFPNCITERKVDGKVVPAVDFDMLRQELSDVVVEGPAERYQFTWPDKRKSVLAANAPIAATLRPVRNDETAPSGCDSEGKPYCSSGSVNYDTTENLYIEGDNLEVLKLLQKTYLGKIKMIYIDPPYNTGHDFIYEDDFSDYAKNYIYNSGQHDELGNQMVMNLESSGRFHTDWLNMMYPRLKLAKDLLENEGFIFISIDDSEADNLRKMCDEIFGTSNYQTTNYIQVRYAEKTLTSDMNYHKQIEQVLVYRKSSEAKPYLQPIPYGYDKFIFSVEETGKGRELELGGKRVIVFEQDEYRIIKHEKGWKDGLKEVWATGSILNGNSSGRFFRDYLNNRKNVDGLGVLYKVYDIGDDQYDYRYFSGPKKEDATKGKYYQGVPIGKMEDGAVKTTPIPNFYDMAGDFGNIRLEGGVAFNSGKKPIRLLQHYIDYFQDKNFIVLDFFSGSASTAHAVMQANAADNGTRKFIMVQISELCAEGSDAHEAGFSNICEIGKERIRRAGEKIKADSPLTTSNLDVGFRVLKLDSSNMKDVYYQPNQIEQTMLTGFTDNIKEDRAPEDLLFQVMLDLGVLLSSKIEETVIAGKKVFNVAEGYLIACFDSDISNDVVTAIAQMHPSYAVFRDSGFRNDSTATNFEQIFTSISPETERKIL